MNIKKLIILYFFFSSFLLFSQIPENLNYIQTLDRTINYSSTLLTNGNRLYVDAQGGIEEYLINADGSLELICYISTINQSGVNACIYENYLYVVTQDNDNTNTLIYVINISGDQMYLEQIYDTNSTIGMYKININEEYIIFVNNRQVNATVLNRNTLEFVCNLTTGGFFKVDENLLYYQVNNGSSNYLFIDDISNISNPVNISSVYLSEDQQNMRYLLEYPYLYIGQNEQVVILDVSDENDPVILSVIEDFEYLSFPNFFKSLIRRENFLIIRNTRNNIWIYDISDIYDPIFENFINEFGLTQCIKDGLISYGDFLYLGQPANNIFQIDAQQLPYLNYINEYGNCGQFIYYGYFYPYLIYSNYYTEEVRFVNILFPNFGSFQLLANANAFVHSYYSNDNVIGFIIADVNDNKHLNIYSYDQYSINLESSNSLSHNDFNDVAMINDYLGIVAEDSGEIQICSINPDYSIEIVHTLYVGEDAEIIQETDQCSDEQFFVCSEFNNEEIIKIFESQYPFNEIGSFSLSQFGYYIKRMFRLSDNRILLYGFVPQQGYYKLAEFNSPEDIVILDTFTTYNGNITLHDDFLIYKRLTASKPAIS